MSEKGYATLEFLQGLNPEQLQAVKTNDVPLMIIAGAGSGKTKVITSKIAFLIKEGLSPENILALTFTQKAAEEMSNRVANLLPNINDLQVFTFHSFCRQFLLDNILETSLNSNFKVLTNIAQLVYFAKNINSFGLEHLKFTNNSYTLAEEVTKFISRCKDEFISHDELIEYIQKKNTEELSDDEREQLNILDDLSKMYRSYEMYKTEQNMIDFGDMLFIVYDILQKNKKILARYQNKFKYIMVDEFQDTNFVQLQIVNLLSMTHKKICVVGDDDQSIYRFRGAYVTNIAEFKRLYPDSIEISLIQNYRSTKTILETANSIIANNPERLKKELRTENEHGGKISVVECDTEIGQTHFVVDNIQQIMKEVRLKDIAVLCRIKSSFTPIANELKKRGIAFELVGTSDFFSKGIIKDVVSLLKIIDNSVSSFGETIRILERDVYCLKKTDVAKLGNLAHEKMCGVYESFDFIDEIDIDKSKFLKVKKLIDNLISSKNKLNLQELIYTVLFHHDFYKYELHLNNHENISALNKFYKFTEEFVQFYPNSQISEFISYIEVASGFEIETEQEENDRDCVKIMTVHSAKGKEFQNVFVIDVAERKFPSVNRSDKFQIPQELFKGVSSTSSEKELHIQEERRIFYVAITRAQKRVFISYAKRYKENITDSKPSRFLMDIDYKQNRNITFAFLNENKDRIILDSNDESQKITRSLIADLHSENYINAIEKILLLAKVKAADVDDIISHVVPPNYEMLQMLIKNVVDHREIIKEDFEFSVSQFNTYERCPRIYEYHYIYRIPTKAKHYFDFGGTVHKVIEELGKKIKNGDPIDMEIAESILKKEWNPKGFESKIQEKQDLEEIRTILETFLTEESKSKKEILEFEKEFTIDVNDYIVKGRIDRIDRDGDDISILDYKTSKESSSAKKAMEDFQLAVYTIATENMYGKIPKSVGWWFLRKNKRVMVTLSQENIEKSKQNMTEIVTAIRNGDFHATPGYVCKNCDYRTICDACQ